MPLREIQGPAGRLETILEEPGAGRRVGTDGLVEAGASDGLRAAVVFGHPHPQYGGTMHNKVVYHSTKALVRIGCAVLRFNFRGTGTSEGMFEDGAGERDDFLAALDFMAARYPGRRLWAAGMSFGAWVGMNAGADHSRVSALIGVAIPVMRDFTRVLESNRPKFFIHGERDELSALKEVRELYARAIEPKELVVIEAADHLFDGKVGEVADAIEDLLGDW
jgi:alpha/beta superfamily hydrolase